MTENSAGAYAGKNVVITGAATGVGAALVEVLREQGVAHITALDIKPAEGVDTFLQVDLSDKDALDAAAAQIADPVHVLFNNAGVAETFPVPVMMGVNVLAPRRLTAILAERMAPGTAVVNTASIAGSQWAARKAEILELLAVDDWDKAVEYVLARPELTEQPYMFSKECSQISTMVQALELRSKQIRVNSVCPGIIDTPLIPDFEDTLGAGLMNWQTDQGNGRKATAREIAVPLSWLGTDAATYVNGLNMVVDAGFTAALLTDQLDFSTFPA